MRTLMLHVDNFACHFIGQTEKDRSKFSEEIDQNLKSAAVDEALLILASVEKAGESNPEAVAQKATEEIARLAGQLKIKTIAIRPFAHPFGELSTSEIPESVLKLVEMNLSQNGFRIFPFDMGLTWRDLAKLSVAAGVFVALISFPYLTGILY